MDHTTTYTFPERPITITNGSSAAPDPTTNSTSKPDPHQPKYKECLRNHAASVGGLVVDGCGEFMPGGGDAADPLKCAVCGCHRSFHRKDPSVERPSHVRHHSQLGYYYHPYHAASNGARRAAGGSRQVQPPPLLSLPPPLKPSPIAALGVGGESSGGTATESSSEEVEPLTPVAAPRWTPAATGHVVVQVVGHVSSSSRKRFRTKFTSEQKGRMMAFAGSLGWRMQRRDEGAVERFCAEIGVSRKVFKVWMHNNKHSSASSAAGKSELQHHHDHERELEHEHDHYLHHQYHQQLQQQQESSVQQPVASLPQ